MKTAIHNECEECGAKLTADSGRDYIQAPGGWMMDVCGKCAEMFHEEEAEL